jgi:hypothetical protein
VCACFSSKPLIYQNISSWVNLVLLYRWQFTTEGYDLGFGVYQRTKDEKQHAGKMVAIIPTQRVDSHLVPEDGSVAVKEPGICKFRQCFIILGGRRGRDRMVVGFTTTCAINTYHH